MVVGIKIGDSVVVSKGPKKGQRGKIVACEGSGRKRKWNVNLNSDEVVLLNARSIAFQSPFTSISVGGAVAGILPPIENNDAESMQSANSPSQSDDERASILQESEMEIDEGGEQANTSPRFGLRILKIDCSLAVPCLSMRQSQERQKR